MKPLFLGGHPAIDFLNTSLAPGGERIELVGDGAAWVAWLAAAELVDGATAARVRRFERAALDEAAAEARRFREWARAWLARWIAGERPTAAELRRVNELLERAPVRRELAAAPGGPALVLRTSIEAADQLVSLVAAAVAQLVAGGEPERIKPCAGDACTLWFVDRTKASRRRFCSAAACGNRAKVAAFRERQRGA